MSESVTYLGGRGSVKIPSKRKKGLRNKRKAYWSGLRMAVLKEKMKRARAEKRKQRYEDGDGQGQY